MLCDRCPGAYHPKCVGLPEAPVGDGERTGERQRQRGEGAAGALREHTCLLAALARLLFSPPVFPPPPVLSLPPLLPPSASLSLPSP